MWLCWIQLYKVMAKKIHRRGDTEPTWGLEKYGETTFADSEQQVPDRHPGPDQGGVGLQPPIGRRPN